MASTMVSSFTAERQSTVLGTAGVTSPEIRSGRSFWSVLAQKAKSVLLEDSCNPLVPDSLPNVSEAKSELKPLNTEKIQTPVVKQNSLGWQVTVGRPFQKSLDAIASSLSLIGDTIGTAIEDSFHLMESKPSVLKTGTPEQGKSLQRSPSIWKKVETVMSTQPSQSTEDSALDNMQLKASRDVAMAMASKAKLLLRELKKVKAEQAFLKGRCAQLEEENRLLREGVNHGDELVRQQLESLLAEKQRLAQENANYSRENQLLHEVVEYHHLTLQDLQDVSVFDDRLTGAAENFEMCKDEGCFDTD